MAKRLGQLMAMIDTPLIVTPVSIDLSSPKAGEWHPGPLTGRFQVLADITNPDGNQWLIALLITDLEGQEVTSSLPGLAYSSGVGGHYSYMRDRSVFDVQLPAGYTCHRILARRWEVSTNTDTPTIIRQLTLRRLLPISLE